MKPIMHDKLWCIANKKGFILNFSIYQGKNESLEREFEDFNLGERIVLKLTKPYWKQSRLIFFDNYFTSIILLERLKTEQTLACGTIRSNRKGMPNNLMKDSAIARGEYDCRFLLLVLVYSSGVIIKLCISHLTITETKLQVF